MTLSHRIVLQKPAAILDYQWSTGMSQDCQVSTRDQSLKIAYWDYNYVDLYVIEPHGCNRSITYKDSVLTVNYG